MCAATRQFKQKPGAGLKKRTPARMTVGNALQTQTATGFHCPFPAPLGVLDHEVWPFEQRRIVRLNGLRVYINVVSPDALAGGDVFYSRRADGPYYRWCYEEKVGRWRGSRVHASDLTPRELSMATWKGVPSELKTRLREHYLE